MKFKGSVRKVIHINCHSISLNEYDVLNSFPSRMAINLKRYSDRYESECWHVINNIKKEQIWRRKGITYRLFPGITINKSLEWFFGLVFSKSFAKALIVEREKTGTIYHIQGERGLLVWKIINIVKGRPIIIQFHGYRGVWFLRPLERIIEVGEKYLFKYVNYFLVHFRARVDYLINYCHVPKEKILFQNLGVDYEVFKPIDKKKIRKELGIPEEKKVILYVGGAIKYKGVDKIIRAHQMVKDKYNTFLLLIGISKGDIFYEKCKTGSDMMLGKVPHQIIAKYYNAADVCCMICPKERRRYGGLGITAIEAMACNVPIMNSNFDDVPDEIKGKIGLKVTDEFDLAEGLTRMFEKKVVFDKDIRKITEKYLSWRVIMMRILKIYESFDLSKI